MPIKHLHIKNFRNHLDLNIEGQAKFVNIVGENGTGKTNILEAISLFAPGRGLRNSKYDEIVNNNSEHGFWFANCELSNSNDENKLHTSFQLVQSSKRNIKVNETTFGSANNFLEYMRIVWLTPRLDGIFGEASASRRKFFDRICYNVYPHHAINVYKFENAIRSRNKLLKENCHDDYWLSAYEQIIAEQSLIIVKTRKFVLSHLQEALQEFTSGFLKPILNLNCPISDNLDEINSSTALESLLAKQKESREKDRYRGRSTIGAHKTEFIIKHPTKMIVAEMCSTGEQKAMVISTLIAHLKCIEINFKGSIILLLDDIFSHLDGTKKTELIEELNMTGAQVWTTSADILHESFKSKDNVTILI